MDIDQRGTDTSQGQDDGRPQAADSAPEQELGMEDLLRESDYAFRRLHRGETVEGTVVRVDEDEVLVDVGLKSEGLIPARELAGEGEPLPDLHVGDRILVVVVQPEGQEGHAILSLRRARIERAWREIEEIYQRGSIVEAPVVEFNKGGLIVDVFGVRGFVPVSQVLDLRNVSRQEGETEEVTQTLTAMVGRSLPLKVIEINRHRNRLILSERAAVQERRTQRKDELMENLQPGQIRHGVVSNITTFGAFVDLGGADGLVHVSELSYNRVNHPSEVLRVGQEVDVMVLTVDRDTKKIALSLKRAMPDPWDTVEQDYHIGQVVEATITKLAKFGAFAKVQEGLEGLIHLSELTDRPVTDPAQVVQEGQVLPAKIIHINSQRRRLGLSARQAQEPQYYGGGSFGAFDNNATFAPDLASYAENNFGDEQDSDLDTTLSNEQDTYTEPSAGDEQVEVVEAETTLGDEQFATADSTYEEPTDSQDSPAVESEPQAQDENPASSEAVTSDDASPVSEEDTSQTEDQAPEVASATGQASDQL